MSTSEYKYQLQKGTESIGFIFKPIQPNNFWFQSTGPSNWTLEWMICYIVDWSLDSSATFYDMGKVKYFIYNYQTPAWETLSSDGHFFHKNNAGDDEEYIGHLTQQVFYVKLDEAWEYLNPAADYDTVKVKISFNVGDDEEFNNTYTKFPAEMTVLYNGIVFNNKSFT